MKEDKFKKMSLMMLLHVLQHVQLVLFNLEILIIKKVKCIKENKMIEYTTFLSMLEQNLMYFIIQRLEILIKIKVYRWHLITKHQLESL